MDAVVGRIGRIIGRPFLGSGRERFTGNWGVLTIAEERLVCHICGRSYRSLGSHVARKHGLLADEYRTLFGLRAKTTLWAADLKAQGRELHLPVLSRYWGKGGVAQMTPEEHSRQGRGRRWALEALQDPHHVVVRQEAGRKGSATQRRRIAEGTLVRKQPQPPDPDVARAKAQARLRELWQDPEWRARTITHIKAGQFRVGFSGSEEGTAPRPCIVCGNPFVSRTGRRTCSDACETARRRAPRRERKQTTCRVCGKEFISRTGRQTCSEACARAATRAHPPRELSDETRQRISQSRLERRRELAPAVAEALAARGDALLTPRDREMVGHFFGLVDGRPWPLVELEERYHLTEGGVHRAVKVAIRRILPDSGGSDRT